MSISWPLERKVARPVQTGFAAFRQRQVRSSHFSQVSYLIYLMPIVLIEATLMGTLAPAHYYGTATTTRAQKMAASVLFFLDLSNLHIHPLKV